jgi:hypothetical protein
MFKFAFATNALAYCEFSAIKRSIEAAAKTWKLLEVVVG